MNLLPLLIVCLATATPDVPTTGDWVRVVTRDGQQYEGVLNTSSDAEPIVLRRERGGIRLEHTFNRQQLQSLATVKRPVEPHAVAPSRTDALPPRTGPFRPLAEFDTPTTPDQRPVRSTELRFSASSGNWTTAAAVDGLLLDVSTPLGTNGRGVRGTLEIELYGWQTSRDRRPDVPRRLERWVVPINGLENSGRTTFELPYRQSRPATDTTLAPGGLVQIRVNIPGEEVVQRSLTDVRLRPYSSWRDRLQQTTGRRYLSTEWLRP